MSQAIATDLLGASEAAVALGLHPYRSPLELWLEKTGQTDPFAGNAQTEWGLLVEPALRNWYAQQTQLSIWVPDTSLISPQFPFLRATPDGLVLSETRMRDDGDVWPRNAYEHWLRGFEAKKAGLRTAHRWGEPGTDDVPIEYLIQCTQGMAVTGLDEWHLVVSIGGEPPAIYEVHRDDELIGMIVEGGARFMAHVRERTPPAIDHTEAWASYLRERYPWSNDVYLEGTPDIEELVGHWKAIVQTQAELERDEAKVKNQIAQVIGTASGLNTAHGKVTYKPSRGGPNHASALKALMDSVGMDETARASLLAAHQKKESRPLRRPTSWTTGGDR